MDLNNKHVLLTGASGGIGQEIALALEESGAQVTLVARNEEKLEQIRYSMANPDLHSILAADLLTPEGRESVVIHAKHQVRINKAYSVVINNAGSNQFQFLAQRTTESIEREVQLNLMTPIALSQSALGWLRRPGIILNIGSTFGSIGYPGYATYCASKGGLHRFTEALDRELDGSGIRVLYLAPRATDTELNSKQVVDLNKKLGNRSDAPQAVAKHVTEMLEKEKTARWIGWPEKLFARVNQIFPNVVSRSIRKQQETIHYFINHTNK
ncbi:SDR family oxidoreductase [Vibrio sp. S4M6]|uniref:SDR family oxidoreductase n=1 Tax=Vibrio sinus TaxID=2946865 RepID=UPI00202A0FA2|nr:SDR family oxidoreductase [Vibrio sinus]MCL9781989.1 SDR family oxidoreductase [Vibrio sinus]